MNPATRRGLALALAAMLVAAGCSAEQGTRRYDSGRSITSSSTSGSPDSSSTVPDVFPLAGFLDAVVLEQLALDPETATDAGLGVAGFDDTWRDRSAAGTAAIAALAATELERLDEYRPETPGDTASAAIARWWLDDLVAAAPFAVIDDPVSFVTGFHADFPEFMADVQPLASLGDAKAYVTRLERAGAVLATLADLVADRTDAGILSPLPVLQIAGYQIDGVLGAGDASRNPLVTDFAARLGDAGLTPADRDRVVELATEAVQDAVIPAYRNLAAAVSSAPGRSDREAGVWAVPGGAEYYEWALRHHLTIDLDPSEVHRIGLEQVDRVVAELTAALEGLGYATPGAGGLGAAVAAAGRDAGTLPLATAADRDAALATVASVIRQAESAFQADFTVEPAATLEVARPRPGRESGGGAYYRAPAADGSRPGIYYQSLAGSGLDLLSLRTTAYHEGVPGHHFQLAVQRENSGLPLTQRVPTFTGFAEGWALYAERLAFEAGLYAEDPLGNIGRLQMELLRAARMVVDTGIHADRWSRTEGIAYLTDLGFERDRAASEVDRYLAWPGQAPSYMVGMLEILDQRARAQEELGDDFDLAAFHDAVLSTGAMPLAVLGDVVDGYIGEVAGS